MKRQIFFSLIILTLLFSTIALSQEAWLGSCYNEKPGTFVTQEGGCKHETSGIVWSISPKESMNYSSADAFCSNYRDGKYTDWRLPSSKELGGIAGEDIEYYFRFDDIYDVYWTSDGSNPDLGIVVSLTDPSEKPGFLQKDQTSRVLCARKGIMPGYGCKKNGQRFFAAHGGCYDSKTKVAWSKQASHAYVEVNAVEYCDSLNEGGFDDWYLPKVDMLREIAGKFYLKEYFKFSERQYWSSTKNGMHYVFVRIDSPSDPGWINSNGDKKGVVCVRTPESTSSQSSSIRVIGSKGICACTHYNGKCMIYIPGEEFAITSLAVPSCGSSYGNDYCDQMAAGNRVIERCGSKQ